MTSEDVLWALLDYYDANPYYTYGGLEAVEEQGDRFVFTVYASVSTNPANFAVKAQEELSRFISGWHMSRMIRQNPRGMYTCHTRM